MSVRSQTALYFLGERVGAELDVVPPGHAVPIERTAGEKSGEWNMDEPRNLAVGGMEWTDDAPGIRAREAVRREDWCQEGHRGYVVSGEIEYELDEGLALRAAQGEAFFLPPADLGIGTYRGRNTAPKPTRPS